MKENPEALHEILRSLLRETLRLNAEGGGRTRLDHARGYVDGFMRALVDGKVSDQTTLLRIVREVRAEAHGPATHESNERYAAA